MANQLTPLKNLMASDLVKQKLQEVLGQKAQGFSASVIQIASSNKLLAKAEPATLLNAAITAAVLELPINQNLGYAWIVPYKGQAQFQMGYKGFVQLALRTNEYKSIGCTPVYENQYISFDPLTEELEYNKVTGEGEVVGYTAYFRLLNGFEKRIFWTSDEVRKHAKRFSKAFGSGPWKTDFEAMATKTVLKSLLSKWGILSIEMQKAVEADQAVQTEEGQFEYVDNDGGMDIGHIEETKERERIQIGIENSMSLEELQQYLEAAKHYDMQEIWEDKSLELEEKEVQDA